jgi:hypothetical protein
MSWLGRWWYWSVPPERLALIRALVGTYALCYLAYRTPSMLSAVDFLPQHFTPVGLVRLLDAPLPPWLVVASVALVLLTAPLFTLGFAYRYTAPLFALSLLWVTTYRSSWGMVFHTDNLLALHVILLAASPASDVLSIDARRARRSGIGASSEPDERYGWVLRAMSLVTVVTYVLAGMAKLKLAGGPWLGGELLRAQIAYDNLRKLELGSQVSPLGPWLVRKRAVFPALAVMTMMVELGAPVALVRRRFAVVWASIAWGFHLGVALLMSIAFVYQLCGLPYLSFFPIERAFDYLKARRHGRSSLT